MIFVVRLLGLLALIEALVCGWLVQQRLTRTEPVLPPLQLVDDPRFREELSALAAAARQGGPLERRALGEALLGHGFYGEAESAFRSTLAEHPQDHAAQFGLALCLDRTGRVQESIPEYRRAAELRANTSERASQREHCLYAIGRAYLKLEDVAAAEAAFRENQAFPPAAYQWAKILVRTGRDRDAAPVIQQHLSRSPLSLFFNFLELRSCLSADRTSEARAAADRLSRAQYDLELNFNTDFIDPFNRRYGMNAESEAYNRLIGTGDMDRIAAKLREVLESVAGLRLPHRISALQRLGETELQRRNPQAILAAMSELRELGVENADTLQLEGAAYALNGDLPRAGELWLRAERMSPNVLLEQRLAAYSAEIGDETAQRRHLARAALLTAKLHFWSSEFDAARTAALQATELDPSESQAWFYVGEAARELGDENAARTAYQRCLEINPQHGRAGRRINPAAAIADPRLMSQ